MNTRALLIALLAAVILVPAGLIAAYIWRAGLDLHSPANARQWIKVCARSREDMYCHAAARVMNEVRGPVAFLHPNQGDRDTTAELTRWKGRTPTREELDAVARANLFPVAELKPGAVTSLDGQTQEVVCGLPNERDACRIGHLRLYRRNQPRSVADGSIYAVQRLTRAPEDTSGLAWPFFTPR